MSIQIKDFGKTTAGQPVKVGILANDTIEVHILSYGATIQQLLVPDRKGNKVDVVLGYPTVQDYELNTLHCMVLCGMDDQNFVVADPLDFNRVVPRVQFMKIYRQLGRRAVVIKKDS